jgi:acetylglutamate kinase
MPNRLTTPCTVIKLGGRALEAPEISAPLVLALAERQRERPGGSVIVHGGGSSVDRLLRGLGHSIERREGIRITPPEQIDLVAGVLAGTVNKRLVAALCAAGAPAVGLCLGDGGIAACVPLRGVGFDPGAVGEVEGGDPRLLRALLDDEFLPVLSSIGFDAAGGLLNLNADTAAAGLAALLGADELLLLSDVPGVLGPDETLCERLDRDEIERGIAEGWIGGGMIAKVRSALSAAEGAGVPVRIGACGDLALIAGASGGTRIEPTSSRSHRPEPIATR